MCISEFFPITQKQKVVRVPSGAKMFEFFKRRTDYLLVFLTSEPPIQYAENQKKIKLAYAAYAMQRLTWNLAHMFVNTLITKKNDNIIKIDTIKIFSRFIKLGIIISKDGWNDYFFYLN